MPGPKRHRRERTQEWAAIKNWTLWPEQELYEQIRPIILFHETAGERAKEIDVPQRTLSRKADAFERSGMQSLFSEGSQGGARETGHSLPEDVRQLIVELHAELPAMSWREIAGVCYLRFGRNPSHHSVKHIASSAPSPAQEVRRYQPWHLIADPAERKLAVIRLHSEARTVRMREVTITCVVCARTVTQVHYPSGRIKYCSEACRDARRAQMSEKRVRKQREKRRVERGTHKQVR